MLTVTKDNPLKVLSLGAGVQSSTLALMAIHGEIEAPDLAIFADTGAEPKAVYEWLNHLEKLMPWPLARVMKKEGLLENIRESIKGKRFAGAPFFTESDRGKRGSLRRQCTREFKIEPIIQELRRRLGAKKGQKIAHLGVLVHQSIGISMDEIIRMKPSRDRWIQHKWPLIELNMTRKDCMIWLTDNGYKVPCRSACTFCPYHHNYEWLSMKIEDPEAWKEAVEIDEMIRGGVRGTTQKLYLHSSLRPLDEIDFESLTGINQPSLFGEECEGMCGV